MGATSLAYAEIYVTLATIFRRFDLELYETTREDVDAVRKFQNYSSRFRIEIWVARQCPEGKPSFYPYLMIQVSFLEETMLIPKCA